MEYEILTRELICRSLPTAMCHASTVLPMPDGSVLCAWFGGSCEGNPDVAVWVARRENDRWSDPVSIVHPEEAHWNPVLQLQENGDVRLYYKIGALIADWRTMVCRSTDGGRTWGMPEELVKGDNSGGRGPVRSKVIRLASGRYLAPCSTERGVWKAYADRSDDGGAAWTRSEPVMIDEMRTEGEGADKSCAGELSEQPFYRRGVIQPTLWESAPGRVHMLLRSTEERIYRSDSDDGGETWCGAYPTELPNNNSGIDLDRLSDGTLILACNPVAANWGERSPLRLLCSKDNGGTWETLLDLESGAGEFSYPAVFAQGNEIHITYTRKRLNIAYWRISVKT